MLLSTTSTVLAQLDADIHSTPCISLVVTDYAQLLVYVRFFHKDKKKLWENLLGVTPPATHTRRKGIQQQ